MKLIRIDNVFFQVGELDLAVLLYEKLGFQLKLKIPRLSSAILNIGMEEPGLILTESKHPKPSRLWIEVASAIQAKEELQEGSILETATGTTLEVTDPWGNIVGFADYIKKTEPLGS